MVAMSLRTAISFLLLLSSMSAEGPDPDRAAVDVRPVEPSSLSMVISPVRPTEEKERLVDWTATLRQAGMALAFQHAFRVAAQPKTRSELGGPFFGDYAKSLRGIRGWNDGDSDFVNYVAHPIMGATAGYIYAGNDSRGDVEFEMSGRYWASRLRATGFAAVYTAAFEVAPISEASIGNVGAHPGTNGAVDFVMTPIGGLGMMMAEDVLDKHVLRPIERRSGSRWLAATLRCLLNPARSAAQISRFKPPWRRAGRPLVR